MSDALIGVPVVGEMQISPVPVQQGGGAEPFEHRLPSVALTFIVSTLIAQLVVVGVLVTAVPIATGADPIIKFAAGLSAKNENSASA